MTVNMPTMEKILLKGLISSDDYSREITPYIKSEYFETLLSKTLFNFYYDYFTKYNCNPTKDYFELELENYDLFNEEQFEDGKEMISEIFMCDISKYDKEWFKSESEKWCQNRAIINAVMDSISVIDGSDKNKTTHAIPDMMRDALAVSFDTHIGHDYIDDHAERFAFYHDVSKKFGFDMEYFNKITNGGVSRKTLNCILAMTGGGKSQLMCHFAAMYAKMGLNVLYITCEMAEERIAERIDANLMDVAISDIAKMSEMTYIKKIDKINKNMMGKIVVKEYSTASSNVNHVRQLLQELKMKKNFIPDIIFVDYLNIMASSRYSGNTNANSYTIVKAIAEELRGLAQEENVVIWTATQTNRCLGVTSKIVTENGVIDIGNVHVGDKILSHDGYKDVIYVYPKTIQKTYKIKTKTGREIICSGKHIFPTDSDMKSIDSGMCIGDYLFVESGTSNNLIYAKTILDEIVSIEEVGEVETIDITVSGDNLFIANGILTHNSGIDASDLSMTDVSDSIGLAYTCDLLFGIVSIPELEERGQVMIKQLKNRYNDLNTYNKFIIGVNRSKMQFFDLSHSAQTGLHSTEQAPFDDEKGSAGFGFGSEHAETKDKFNEVNFD